MKVIVKLVAFFGIMVTVLWGGYTVDYSPSEFSFYKENGFDRIKAIKFALIGEPGTPELPAVYLNYIIPSYAKVESLIVSQSDINQIYGAYLVYPAQPARVIGESIPWVGPDSLIYNSDELFPGEFVRIVSHGVMDGARIVTIEVRPLQYRPKSRRLFLVRNITFEFSFGPNTMPDLRPQIRGRYEQAVYDAAIRNTVVNDNEVPVYYQRPAIVEENQLGGAAPYPVGPGVIITPDDFKPYFQPYANWMTDQGIRTVMISPQTIYAYFTGVDNAEKVRNYIKHCYQTAGGTYFILGGDDYFVPIRYCIAKDSVFPEQQLFCRDSIPCDMYFSDLTGNWNTGSDFYWGETRRDSADRFPEVFVGRITAYNTQEVQNWATKALHYEKTPGVVFNHALWVTTIIGQGVGNGSAPSVFPDHFIHHYATDYWADAVLNEINQGYAFLNVNCHGNIGDFATKFNSSGGRIATVYSYRQDSPSQSQAGLNWLTNVNKYSVGYSISCFCGAFDSLAHAIYYEEGSDTCIADAFVDAFQSNLSESPIGACAYLVNTRDGWLTYSHNLQYEFWGLIMNPWWVGGGPPEPSVTRIGVAEAFSKCGATIDWDSDDSYIRNKYRYVCYTHCLFGSPYFETWTKTPGNMIVTHPTQIPAGVQTDFTVTVKTATLPPVPLQYAKVCLNKTDDIYEVGSTNGNGQVTFTIKPKTTGTIKVTVTRLHNADNNYTQYRPSETYCEVILCKGGGQSSGLEEMLPSTLCITQMTTISRNNSMIGFGVPKKGDITISVYDATGSRVNLMARKNVLPGYYQEKIDMRNLSSGIYFIMLKQDNDKVTGKFLVVI